MKREDVYTVKIYFVKPVDLITVVVNTLVELEYETYTVPDYDSDKLLKILPRNKRSIVFVSITNKNEATRWLDYGRKAIGLPDTNVQVGAFVYTNMEAELRGEFLSAQIPAISFSNIQSNTVKVLEQILRVFDARGMRRYVRVNTRGISVAFMTLKGRKEPVRCPVHEISAVACVCEIPRDIQAHFQVGAYIPEVMLALRGIRIRTAVQIVGFSQENKDFFILKFVGIELKDGKMNYSEKTPGELRHKIHTYVRSCLKENLSEQLEKITTDS
jgi:hypothetical protein